MTLWVLKRVQAPVPSPISDSFGATVTVLDKDSGDEATIHIDITNVNEGNPSAILQEIDDAGYTPNDFGL